MIRRTLFSLAIGALLGVAVAMIWGPGLITWWGTPPVADMAKICGTSIQWATTRLVRMELGLAATGAVVLALVANVIAVRRHKPQQTPPPTTR